MIKNRRTMATMKLRIPAAAFATIVTLLCCPILRAQSRKPEQLRAGKLLVAQREAMDPNFEESVVLIINYGENGALGLIINQRTKVPISRALPELQGARNYLGPAYLGGPVSRGAVTALLYAKTRTQGAAEPKPEPAPSPDAEQKPSVDPPSDADDDHNGNDKPIFGNVYFVTHKTELETALKLGLGSDELRIYAGYAGWGGGQLENEVKRGAWYIFDATEQTVFDSEPQTLWSRLIAQTEVRIALGLQHFPAQATH
jgi:putative transcriptional regulator